MNEYATLQNFVFRGLLLNETLGGLAEAGVYVSEPAKGEVSREDNVSLDDFSMTIRVNALKMSALYTAFFCFENTVREFIVSTLKEKHGAAWWNTCASQKLRAKIEERKKRESKNKWHDTRGTEEIAYADFGDLADIIVTNWADFEQFFPDQDWIRTRLGDLELSRNVIAHNNVLSERDILRIRSHLGDWLRQVG